jgi:hypothetical protein
MSNYNSFEGTPENSSAAKAHINQINDHKRLGYQKHKYSSFEASPYHQRDWSSAQDASSHNFYLNRERISTPLATH